MIQNNSRGFFDHGFQVEYAVHANEEGKKDIGIFILRMWIRCDWNDAVD